jgi:N-acetyl-anhydromuramyl-L-alanine amidase AmpD
MSPAGRIRTVLASEKNYTKGRSRAPISMLVIHTTEGSLFSALSWFRNPKARVSAHYVVGKDGTIVRCVDDSDTAWHAGNMPVNRKSIGIELEGNWGNLRMSPQQKGALVELCDWLCSLYAIPRNREAIIGHCDVPDPIDPKKRGGISHKKDPGPDFPWDWFMASLNNSPGVV